MPFQPQPTTGGTYRVKLYQTDSNRYWKYVPLGRNDAAWIQLGSIVPESNPNARMLQVTQSIMTSFALLIYLPWKWVITPVSGQTDTFTIEPVYKGPNDSQTFGMKKEEAFSDTRRSPAYQYQVVGRPGSSAYWKIVKDTSGAYSKSGSHLQSLAPL